MILSSRVFPSLHHHRDKLTPMIFKIVDQDMWLRAVEIGRFDGAAIDIADGFIHFSSVDQAKETAAKHFSDITNLLLVAIDDRQLGPNLKWEVSRGGALFPHLYGALDPNLAVWAKPLAWKDGSHQFPVGWNS